MSRPEPSYMQLSAAELCNHTKREVILINLHTVQNALYGTVSLVIKQDGLVRRHRYIGQRSQPTQQ